MVVYSLLIVLDVGCPLTGLVVWGIKGAGGGSDRRQGAESLKHSGVLEWVGGLVFHIL